jgi:hypothetical protein
MDAFGDFIDEATNGRFNRPTGAGWTAEQIVAHVARNNEELIATTEAVLAGDEPSYDNSKIIDVRELDAYIVGYGGLRGLTDRVAQTVAVLRDLAGQLGERGLVEISVRIRDGDAVALDGPLPWAKMLEMNGNHHAQLRLDQLRALRVAADADGVRA